MVGDTFKNGHRLKLKISRSAGFTILQSRALSEPVAVIRCSSILAPS